MTAYYNEIDPYAAQWLRNLIAAGHIAPGDVDERSIEDVRPAELSGYRQCHFFAGIGVWSHALRSAGISDDTPVWTGSCPCQPFSAAGQGAGFADERHLWPAFFHLIEQCGPAIVLGEQVASADADPWIDLVCADLESLGYACGPLAFPTASVGGPHIRDRLYWVADAMRHGTESIAGDRDLAQEAPHRIDGRAARASVAAGDRCASGGMGNTDQGRGGRYAGAVPGAQGGAERGVRRVADGVEPASAARGLADADRAEREARFVLSCGTGEGGEGRGNALLRRAHGRPGPTNGFWRTADWLGCTDGKWRPVEPGTFPLAHGSAARVGRLRAYGNAINAEAARVFIECVM